MRMGPKYRRAIEWIALHGATPTLNTTVETLAQQETVLLLAHVYDREPDEVAVHVLAARRALGKTMDLRLAAVRGRER